MSQNEKNEPGDKTVEEHTVSVITPTRNRKRLLRETLDALWAQTIDMERLEIVVVDNLSDDGTAEMMAELQETSPCRLIYHVMPTNRGPAPSRNTGVGLSCGAILAFTDDDCRPHPEWIEKGVAAFSDNVGLVTGPVFYKPEQAKVHSFWCRISGEVYAEHPTYTWSNSFYRRDVFLELDGTDESLCRPDFRNRVVDCGDTDLAWRMKEKGYRTAFTDESIVYHEMQELPPMDWIVDPFRLFVVNQLVMRHPQLRRELLFARYFFGIEHVYFYLMLLGLVLALFVSPWYLLLCLPNLLFTAWLMKPTWSLKKLIKLPLQMGFFIARQGALCAGLIYGSIRFRTVVL